jgi:hypothetical protein
VAKKKKKADYKCGHCGETGHNARTCPSKETAAAAPPAEPEIVEPPRKVEPNVVPVDTSVDLLDTDRTRPSRPTGPGCFQCPKCNRASILVLVELPSDQMGAKEMRCELCHNKTPISKILLWGAQPTDAPAK